MFGKKFLSTIFIGSLFIFVLPSCANWLHFNDLTTPVISPEAGTYNADQEITITSIIDGANIYYTIDGSTPNVSSSLYKGAFKLSESATVKAIVVKDKTQFGNVADNKYILVAAKVVSTKLCKHLQSLIRISFPVGEGFPS